MEQPKMPDLTAEQITKIKCGMTDLMARVYCHDVHGTEYGKLCGECQKFRDTGVRHVKACRFAAENRPCPTCPDCCFKGDSHKMLIDCATHFQQHAQEHQGEVQRIMAEGMRP